MRGIYHWIYSDLKGNIWMFSINNNKKLCYRIMYREGEWIKETIIDTKVFGFSIYVDEDEIIHVVYSNIKGELRYCTMKDKKWIGKTLYKVENDKFEMQNLKVKIIEDTMHIFYLQVSKRESNNAVLMHYLWNGRETKAVVVQDIILINNLKECYFVDVNKKGDIDLFFVTDDGADKSLSYCSFENNRWLPAKRIYGIQGENIGFEVLIYKEETHILNKYMENSVYLLEHICIANNGDIRGFRVYESKKELLEPILFTENDKLYSCWIEEGEIFYSNFDGEKWGSEVVVDRGNKDEVERYNCFSCIGSDSSIRERKIYGTNGLDLYLFNPSDFVKNAKDLLKYGVDQSNEKHPQEESLQKFKLELFKVKSEKKNLEKKVTHLSMQLQKNKRLLEEYEERIAKVLEQKRKSDENCNMFVELQKNIQKDLEVKTDKLSEKKVFIETMQRKLEDTKEKLIEERNIKSEIESKLQDYEEENLIIKQELEMVSEEKRRIYAEFELEKNKSIMKRLFKGSKGE